MGSFLPYELQKYIDMLVPVGAATPASAVLAAYCQFSLLSFYPFGGVSSASCLHQDRFPLSPLTSPEEDIMPPSNTRRPTAWQTAASIP